MKVAYGFATDMAATFKLAAMILPQLEDGSHGASVAGMFLFDDNLLCLRERDPVGERLARVAKDQNIPLMIRDQYAARRNAADGARKQCGKGDVKAKGSVAGVQAGCFPCSTRRSDPTPPDFVITL